MQALTILLNIPLMMLNLLGGLVSGVWLAILGEWSILLSGIAIMMLGTFVLSIALLPSIGLGMLGIGLLERGSRAGFLLFGGLSLACVYAVMTIWGVGILYLFLIKADYSSFWPTLIWSYGIAVGPWTYMAQKENNPASMMSAFFMQAGYITMAGMVIFGRPTIRDAGIAFVSVMVVPFLVSMSETWQELRAQRET